jgi:hypothetical protein
LPRQWAFSCFLFTVLLETSRLTSPTTVLYKQFVDLKSTTNLNEERDAGGDDDNADNKKNTLIGIGAAHKELILSTNQLALFAASDYTIGGLVAGGAAALRGDGSSSMSLASRLGRGAVVGALLGLTAGIVQAGVIWAEAQLKEVSLSEAKEMVSSPTKENR